VVTIAQLRKRLPAFRPVGVILTSAVRVAPSSRAAVQKSLFKQVYELASRRLSGPGTALLNYGFAPLDQPYQDLGLSPESEPDRFGLQLYHKVAGAIDLSGKELLEVGCGRGGGTAFVFEHHRPKAMTGLDLAPTAIAHCQVVHGRPGLVFVTGDAEELPFPDTSFDAVLNVESSHCYPDMRRFLSEVHRVLRPGGILLFADLRHADLAGRRDEILVPQEDVAQLREQFAAAGFTVLEEEDITANVNQALLLDSARRRALVERKAPKAIHAHLLDFAAVEGSGLQRAFANREIRYLRLLLERP
jgi:SAM-dependent methyltransferase